jgi:hypothetical protein
VALITIKADAARVLGKIGWGKYTELRGNSYFLIGS